MKSYSTLILSAALLTAACGDDGMRTTESGTDTTTNTTTTDTPPTGTSDTPTGTTTTTTDTPPTGTTVTTTNPATTNEPTTTTDTTGDDPFTFDDTPPDQLVQLDRMGMPAVATAVISADMKDAYNEATPVDDAAQTFVNDIVANVTALHMALDDDIEGAGLVPCDPPMCAVQAGPLVVPDVLKIDTANPAGFPNGRTLADPVVDITLAVVLLDLSVMGQTPATFASLPLNPPENDKPFLDDFPYVAAPH